jgi:uncharacterized phiE125 gp8 family phage protein
MGLSLVTAPTVEPISLIEAKASLKIDTDDDNEPLDALIRAARFRCETITGRQLMTATWELRLDAFPCSYVIEIPKPPLLSITSISYVDTAGATQVWNSSNYLVDAPAGPFAGFGRVQPAYGISWPSTRSDTLNAVLIRFTAGYGAAAEAVPADIRYAIRLLLNAWYEGAIDDDVRALAMMTPYKVYR